MPEAYRAHFLLFGLLVCAAFIPSLDAESPTEPPGHLLGVKIYDYEGSPEEIFAQWRSLRFNTAFVSQALLEDPEFRRLARQYDIDIFLIAPVFFNPEALLEDADLYAITAEGMKAKEDWVEFVCPSRPGYRAERAREIAELAREYRPDGISLDFIRHFVFWEMLRPETPASELPNTCFCSHCTKGFSVHTDLEVPIRLTSERDKAEWILANHGESWTQWKVHLITTMTEEIVAEIRKVDSAIQINIHAVPWRNDDYQGAIRNVAGQDFSELSELTDYLSPMCYSFMLRRDPDWVHTVVRDLSSSTTAEIVPSIQVKEAYRLEERFSNEEFESTLRQALKPPSRGVVFWSWTALTQEPAKLQIVRQILAGSDED